MACLVPAAAANQTVPDTLRVSSEYAWKFALPPAFNDRNGASQPPEYHEAKADITMCVGSLLIPRQRPSVVLAVAGGCCGSGWLARLIAASESGQLRRRCRHSNIWPDDDVFR
jgi:hypothetical protein